MFLFLRKEKLCRGVGGIDPYLPDEDVEFMGNFFLTTIKSTQKLLYINYALKTEQELIIPDIEVLRYILSMENIIDGHLFKKFVDREEIKRKIEEQFEEIYYKCKNPAHILYLASNTSERFDVEVATNFFDFFNSYWAARKN